MGQKHLLYERLKLSWSQNSNQMDQEISLELQESGNFR